MHEIQPSALLPSRLRRRAKVAIGNEAGTGRIIFLGYSARPDIAAWSLGSFYHLIVFLAARRDIDLTVQVCTEEFYIRRLQPVEDRL